MPPDHRARGDDRDRLTQPPERHGLGGELRGVHQLRVVALALRARPVAPERLRRHHLDVVVEPPAEAPGDVASAVVTVVKATESSVGSVGPPVDVDDVADHPGVAGADRGVGDREHRRQEHDPDEHRQQATRDPAESGTRRGAPAGPRAAGRLGCLVSSVLSSSSSSGSWSSPSPGDPSATARSLPRRTRPDRATRYPPPRAAPEDRRPVRRRPPRRARARPPCGATATASQSPPRGRRAGFLPRLRSAPSSSSPPWCSDPRRRRWWRSPSSWAPSSWTRRSGDRPGGPPTGGRPRGPPGRRTAARAALGRLRTHRPGHRARGARAHRGAGAPRTRPPRWPTPTPRYDDGRAKRRPPSRR